MRLRSLVFGLKIESFIHLLIYVTIPMGSSDTMFGKIKKTVSKPEWGGSGSKSGIMCGPFPWI